MTDEQTGPDQRRLDALEKAVAGLAAEVAQLRAEVGQRGAATAPAASPSPPSAPAPRPLHNLGAPAAAGASTAGGQAAAVSAAAASNADATSEPRPRPVAPLPPRATVAGGVVSGGLEQMIGRYGTVAVATLAILLGLGAFIQWAVARGLLGPEVRVGLGAVAAVVLAGLGLRLRSKGSVNFGNWLLAISLAVVHLVAWGAGPILGIVPPMLALGVAAAASVALAALALREGEEFLFLLGLGGALFAPFVTMEGQGGRGQLLLFGGVMLTAAIVAIRDADWRIAPRLISPFAFWYMASAAAIPQGDSGARSIYWPTALALVLSVVALTLGARGVRRGMVRTTLFLVAVGIIIAGGSNTALPWTGVVYALLGTLVAHALRRRTAASASSSATASANASANASASASADADDGPDNWYEVVGVPLLLLVSVLVVEDRWQKADGPAIAAAWVALTTVFLFLDGAANRARHLAVMLTAALLATMGLYHGDAVGIVPAMATVAAVSVFTLHRVPGPALLLPIGISLFFGTLRAWILVDRRVPWEYTPFLNTEALAGATIVAAWLFFSWAVPTALAASGTMRHRLETGSAARALAVLGPVVAFFWVRQELVETYSRDVSTFLLITYYALTGVGTIMLGRKREVDGLRQAGLGLSLFAAFKAVIGASDLDNIGFRVGSYMVVGVFLLGVGYLYRKETAVDG
jgi:uncharacterized membrane protein